jgi:uncharacterized protein (TIGR02265 family)
MDTPESVRLRIQAATEKEQLVGIFVDSSLAHLKQTLGDTDAEALRKEVFGKRNVVTFFRYPIADLLKLVDLGSQRLITRGTPSYHEALVGFGRMGVRYFFDSQAGKMLSFLAGDNPHRLLSTAPSGYKAVTTFGERVYERAGERAARLHFHNDFTGPSWQQGIVSQALETGAKVTSVRVRMEVKNPSGTDFTAHIEW